jgi:hypothetical protein
LWDLKQRSKLSEDAEIQNEKVTKQVPNWIPAADREQKLRLLRTFRGNLPADFKFDREEANER